MSKTCQHVAGAIAAAQDHDKLALDADAEQAWAAMRPELNRLAKTFSLPRNR